ncbi:MAG TPA: hypothetical protein VGN63_06360 [Flavisolibacter sp.]|jgi:hypothetical protein|nr:hypothetical protein [Flavisolibacter sp.]
MKHTLTLHAEKTTSLLLKIIAGLLVAGLISNYVKYALGYTSVMGLVPLFSLNGEYTFPSLFSTFILWFSAALLWFISYRKKNVADKESFYWKGLSLVFVFLGLDELLTIHENFARIEPFLSKYIQVFSKFMYWTVAYGFLVILFAIFFSRFYLRLPKSTRIRFGVAATLYVGGAIGMEIAGAWFTKMYTMPAVSRGIFAAVEEGMEMTGIVLFIKALLLYIHQHIEIPFADVRIQCSAKTNLAAPLQQDRKSNIKVAYKKCSDQA